MDAAQKTIDNLLHSDRIVSVVIVAIAGAIRATFGIVYTSLIIGGTVAIVGGIFSGLEYGAE